MYTEENQLNNAVSAVFIEPSAIATILAIAIEIPRKIPAEYTD
jgi:hypothetical protein